jgi:hypothetical protein
MRPIAGLGILLAVVATAVGCGSGGDQPPTKAEFVAEADAICKRGTTQIRHEYEAFVAKPDAATSASGRERGTEIGVKILLPTVLSQTEDLRELMPPEGDERQVTAILDAFETGVKSGLAHPQTLFGVNYPLDRANSLAQRYGFKVCGQP